MRILFCFFMIFLLFIGCETSVKQDKGKTQQESFYDFINNNKKMSYDYKDNVQKKRFKRRFEKDLAKYLDSVMVFVNWKGQIRDINTKTNGNTTFLKFEIFCNSKEGNNITFHHSHFIKNNEIEKDYIYNKVKDLPNNSYVNIDGFIKRKLDRSVSYKLNRSFLLHMYSPHYNFNVLEINKTAKNDNLLCDTLPKALKNAIVVDFKMMDLFRQEFQKQITKKQRIAKAKSLKFDSVQSVLSEEEKNYSQRVRQYLLNDFAFE